MNVYYWKGLDKNDEIVFGEISAGSISTIKSELIRQNIHHFKIQKKRKNPFQKRINPLEISKFFRNLSTLISSHIPLLRSLNMISKNYENPKLKELIQTISSDISSGINFPTALKKHPNIFSHLTIELITHSELSGNFQSTLDRLALHLEKNEKINKRIKKALLYPSIVLLTVVMTSMLMLLFIIPEFEKLFSTYHAELPRSTQFVLSFSKYITKHWLKLAIFFTTFITGLKLTIKHSPSINYWLDTALLKSRYIGNKIIMAHTFRALSISLSSNLPIITCLHTIENISKNKRYKKAIQQVIEDIKSGTSFHQALQKHSFFPNIIIQMTAVGEELGILDEMLGKIANHLDEEIDNFFDNLNTILEPVIMLILGLFVGGFLLTMYLPIFKLGSVF